MPRPPRIHIEGALYYVTSRALDGVLLFKDAKDYDTYVKLLAAYREEFGFKLFAYVLVPDHLQLVVELTNQTTISEIMHAINSRYIKCFNKRYEHTGHLFQERFKSTIMEKAPSLLRVTGYLHTFPVRSGVATELRTYPWSSYPSYCDAGTREGQGGTSAERASGVGAFDSAFGLAQDRPERVQGRPSIKTEVEEVSCHLARVHPGWTYELYLHSVPQSEWEAVCADLRQRIVGSDAFLAMVEARQKREPLASPSTALQHSARTLQSPPRAGKLSPLLSGSVAAVAVSLIAVWSFARRAADMSLGRAEFRQAMQVLRQEIPLTLMRLYGGEGHEPSAQLASFHQPAVDLTGTRWNVELRPVDAGAAVEMRADQLTFEEGIVISRQLGAKGFRPTRYVLKPRPDGTAAWDTMQADQSGTIMSWHGEVVGQDMRGILTQEAVGRPAATFSFVATLIATPADAERGNEI